MSSLARWSYTNTATVWPRIGRDALNGVDLYGTPYTIACAYAIKNELKQDMSQSQGSTEFVSDCIYWTEDQRPKARDRIARGDQSGLDWGDADGADEIKSRLLYEMTAFGEGDFPDLEFAT